MPPRRPPELRAQAAPRPSPQQQNDLPPVLPQEEGEAQPEQEPQQLVQFSLAPALASGEIIDFSQASGAKLFKSGIEALSTEFNCTAVNLQLFLDQLRDKSSIYNWERILEVPDEYGISKSLIDQYGELSYEKVKSHAETYVNTQTRRAQDSFMLYNCIMNTLSDGAQKQVRNRGLVTPFTINGRGSGTLLLKVVIMVSHVDTRATVTAVRTKLSSLDRAMRELESDVEKFNDHVLSLISQLYARGEQTQDLLVNLFKGYKACKDAEFVEYIKKKEDSYEEGGEVEYNQLMDWAVNKFKARKEAGTWCQKSTEEETLIALQAQLKDLIGKTNKGGKQDTSKANSTRSNNAKKAKRLAKKPTWRTTPPKDKEKESKMVEGKEYHWCPTHKAWTRHKPSECKGIAYSGERTAQSQETKQKETKLKISKALTAISDDDEDE